MSEIDRDTFLRTSNRERLQNWAIDVHRSADDTPIDQMDPGHPDRFEANTALPFFARLRHEDPVNLSEGGQFGRYWSVTRYSDIMYVDRHNDLFSSDSRRGGISLGGIIDPDPDPQFALPMFIQEDRPKHDAQRKVVAPMFTPRHLQQLEELIRTRAGRILDNLPGGETFNWVREVSVELTGQMLATLFEIPQEDRHKLIHWSDCVQNLGNPDYFNTVEEGFGELWKCWEYFAAVWEERKAQAQPGNDLISMLVNGESTRDMPPNEYLGNILLLIVGGNDTTRNSITGGVLALNEHQDEYTKLRRNPGLIPTMVPEIIRWQSPVAHMARTALADTQLGGKEICEGDRVVMWYVSGNRDDSAIDRANSFVVDRANPRRHLSFGYGIHRCLGNRLGEMQLRIVWEEIQKRFANIDVVGDPVYLKSSFIRGIRELPVQVHRT